MIWSAVTAPSSGLVSSTPVRLSVSTSNGASWVCGWVPGAGRSKPPSGTVPLIVTAFTLRLPAAASTPSIAATFATLEPGKLCCAPGRKSVRVNVSPGSPWSPRSKRRGPPSGRSPSFTGRVTDMSVPTPVSGASTFSWARSRPVVSALTVTTSPTPTPSPSAVSRVRPLRRRSSDTM